MTRTLPIVTALFALAAVAPLLTARVIGNLEPRATVEGACLDDVRAPVTPKPATATEGGFCSADAPGARP